MALIAVFLYGEGVLAVMAAAAGVPRLHPGHVDMLCPRLVGEAFYVAVGALVDAEMEFVTEPYLTAIVLEFDDSRLETLVTSVATACRGKGVLVVVTGAARFSLLHVGHGGMPRSRLIGEELGMAILAGI